MVKITTVFVAIAATLSTVVIAAPNPTTAELTFPHAHVGLEPRSRFCINCKELCFNAKDMNEASACMHVCHDDESDESECIDKHQRKTLALALFREDHAYINSLDKDGIEDYLYAHMKSSHHADKRKRDAKFRHKVTGRRCVNCKETCRTAWGPNAQPGDKEVCETVCNGEEHDECEHLNRKQLNAYFTAYFGSGYKSIPGLEDEWRKATGFKRSLVPGADSAIDSDSDEHVGLEKRSRFKVNCRAMCDGQSSIYNADACNEVCKGDQHDCKEKLNHKQVHALLRHFYPGNGEAKWNDCHGKRKCIKKFFFKDWPELKADKHSHC